jgi:hypothetical protein
VARRVGSPFNRTGSDTLSPDATNPIYADVTLELTNTGEPVAGSQMLLGVMKGSELAEMFMMSPSLAVPQGTTTVFQRYIQPIGWGPGTKSFVVRLEVVDATTGSATNVATVDTLPPLEIGSPG